MAIVERKPAALPVPYAIELPDRVPKQRYFDPDFFALEAERLWSRVWQMACRLEEIPRPGDFVEYRILDQSIVVVRTDDMGVHAFQNVCRHRGVRLVQGRGTCEHGFTCPFHGWCYGPDGTNTASRDAGRSPSTTSRPATSTSTPVRCETWGGCAWINLDADAPPPRRVPRARGVGLDVWKVESLRTEQWYACRLPVNWKLAIEAFVEMYHVTQTHPQLVIPDALRAPRRRAFDARAFVDADIEYLRAMSDGMDGMCHPDDVRIAEPARHRAPGRRGAGDRHLEPHAQRRGRALAPGRGPRRPRPERARRAGLNLTFFHALPALLRAADVQRRVVATGSDRSDRRRR